MCCKRNAYYLRYDEIVYALYTEYWKQLDVYDIKPKKYSWCFDRTSVCDKLFSKKAEKLIRRDGTYEILLRDGFLPRFCGRGFSDQTDVPRHIHDEIISRLMEEFQEKYGDDFTAAPFYGNYDDILITIYTK